MTGFSNEDKSRDHNELIKTELNSNAHFLSNNQMGQFHN